MKDEGLEYLLSILPPGPDKSCALHLLPRALDFVREKDEFDTADLQRYLRCRYGNVCQIIDALVALRVIAVTETQPKRYKRVVESSEIDHDIYYNGWVNEADNEYTSAWDPAMFRSKEQCIEYVKASYSGFEKPVYVISKIKIGGDDGWELIEKEVIKGYEEND